MRAIGLFIIFNNGSGSTCLAVPMTMLMEFETLKSNQDKIEAIRVIYEGGTEVEVSRNLDEAIKEIMEIQNVT